MTVDPSPLMECGVAQAALGGAATSGDAYLVHPTACGLLVAVIDGLGHGVEAAAAAQAAIGALAAHAHRDIPELFAVCHEALRGTRGAVMSAASIDARSARLTWMAVGNVVGALFCGGSGDGRPRETVLMRGGILGPRMPRLQAATVPIRPCDLLIFATDGIRGGFERDVSLDGSPQEVADRILARHAKAADDALVLAGRWRGLAAGHSG